MKFETFISLKSNEKALEVAKNKVNEILLKRGANIPVNNIEPLLISTEIPGLGSTHLLKSIESELADLNVVFTYGERFLYPYGGNIKQYCRYLKTGEVLLLEDIQYLFQEEVAPEISSFDLSGSYSLDNQYVQQAYEYFRDVVTSYYQRGKAVIVTTTEKCSEQEKLFLSKMAPNLTSNKVVIQRLTHKDKLALLYEWKSRRGLEFLTDNQIDEIVKKEVDDVRSLEGHLMRLLAERRLINES